MKKILLQVGFAILAIGLLLMLLDKIYAISIGSIGLIIIGISLVLKTKALDFSKVIKVERVEINGRELKCSECCNKIEQETVLKKRIGDKSLQWKTVYVCDNCSNKKLKGVKNG